MTIGTLAIDVQCPECGSCPGMPCWTAGTTTVTTMGHARPSHQARINEAARVTREANRKARTP